MKKRYGNIAFLCRHYGLEMNKPDISTGNVFAMGRFGFVVTKFPELKNLTNAFSLTSFMFCFFKQIERIIIFTMILILLCK